MPWGLSSLGRCEARVLESLDAVIAALARFEPEVAEPRPAPSRAAFFRGHEKLRENTEAATQVLDRFVHKGLGARAEITDAAMAERAECVMLNKGPYVIDAIELLTYMLSAMEGHQFKKVSQMRALRSW